MIDKNPYKRGMTLSEEYLMKKRYLYSLLFGIPGLFVAGIISIGLFAAVTGLLWIYVFGDDPWPRYAEQVLSTLFVLTVLTFWLATIVMGYVIGRKLEKDPGVRRSHILVSAGLTLLFLLLMLIQQWNAGNLGPQSASAQCSDFCAMHGYSGSGTPPEFTGDRICSCYDGSGNEVLRIPLDHLDPDFQR